MKSKVRMKRVGRVWIDKELLEEGYRPEDIIDIDDPVLELPELFDAERRRHVGWIVCPECGDRSQVDRRNPICSSCGWEQDSEQVRRLERCAA